MGNRSVIVLIQIAIWIHEFFTTAG